MAQDNSTPDSVESNQQGESSRAIARYNFLITWDKYELNGDPFQFNTERLRYELENAIRGEFTHQVEFLFSEALTVRLLPLEGGSIEGSILLILAGVGSIYEFVSKYKDFEDSLSQLQKELRLLLDNILNRSIGNRVSRVINIAMALEPTARIQVKQRQEQRQAESPNPGSREFLYYLLVMNIVLMIIISALVYHAVTTVYFRVP